MLLTFVFCVLEWSVWTPLHQDEPSGTLRDFSLGVTSMSCNGGLETPKIFHKWHTQLSCHVLLCAPT